ncbi:MAG: radical SAM protein [bacterium]
MIGCTKLLCGTATIAEAMRHGRSSAKLQAHLLQFSADDRPLVVWNMTNRCNLNCLHCYIDAEDRSYKNELSTEEAGIMIDDLAEMKVPVLLFSGGEPFLRKDLYELGAYAISRGIRAVISSNGTLITREMAKKVKNVGFSYVGISIDGAPGTHDHFRQKENAFKMAVQGIRNCHEQGVKAGVRLTVNKANYRDLPEVMDIVEREKIPRFCMYHLVYSGRGKELAEQDLTHEQSRQVMQTLINKALDWDKRGVETEILTTDNHTDGIYLGNYIQEKMPDRFKEVAGLLEMHGGCSAGKKFANIDPRGDVHPCQFWGHHTLGNVRERKFSQIWTDKDDEFLQQLKQMQKHLKGRCGQCPHNTVCGGCRIRAEAVYGDKWQEDPACYMTDEELGIKDPYEKAANM